MAETTGISWTEATWNPWVGCTRVSAGCDNCYAATLVNRYGGDFSRRRRTSKDNWKQPGRWNRKAEAEGKRRRVFVASLADVFDNQVEEQWRADMWAVIEACPWLDFMLLTKRPQNIRKMLPATWGHDGWPNVWLGTTVETRLAAIQRLPHLISVPAKVHFVSAEPLLEWVHLRDIKVHEHIKLDALTGYYTPAPTLGLKAYAQAMSTLPEPCSQKVDLVIIGGESGRHARPMQMGWAAALIREAQDAGVSVHFKQVGDNREGTAWPDGITGKGDEPEQWPVDFRIQERPHP